MERVIKAVKEENDIISKLAIAVGYLKGYTESSAFKKEFTVEEVLDLLESIRERKE